MADKRERLLFVDDEELTLRGMQRVLLSHQDQWDMVFVDSGAKALALIQQQPFDAVVSDIRMPGMNGVELLTKAAQLQPGMIRIALSSYADRELMLQCVGVTHQYLAKPCDAAILEAVLLRLTDMVRSQRDEPIRQLLARCPNLPSVSKVYSRLIEMVRNPLVTIDEIGVIVAQDAAVSTQVLKLVNSAFFGLSRKISHPSEAALFLGIDTVKYLILSSNLFQPASGKELSGLAGPRIWAHSIACAEAAQHVARAMGGSRQDVNESFVAGLLHEMGRLLLCVNLPADYAQVVERAQKEHVPLIEAERAVLGADHAEVGGYYLGLFGLPMTVGEAVSFHRLPSAATDQQHIPLAALHLGHYFVEDENRPGLGDTASALDPDFIASRGLEGSLDSWHRSWRARTKIALKP